MNIRVFEAFAGYGSQSIALQQLKEEFPGFDYEVVGFSEIDRFAVLAYYAARDSRLYGMQHGSPSPNRGYQPPQELLAKYRNFGDITKIEWEQLPDFDLFTYSFPCQDISSAGLQRGLAEGSGSRSSLLWECAKAIEVKRPKYLLMENVKALTYKKHKGHFERWRNVLEGFGYVNYWAVLNAKNYNVPQNRERVFMVSILGDTSFRFPDPEPQTRRLAHIVESEIPDSQYLNEKQINWIFRHCLRKQEEGCGYKPNFKTVNEISSAITSNYGHRECDTYLAEPVACAYRGRNPDNPGDRRSGIPTAQRLELGGYIANCVTTVEKDSLLAEPKVLGYSRDAKGIVVARQLKDIAGAVCASNHRYTGSTAEYVAEPKVIQLPHGFASGNVLDVSPTVTSSAFADNNLLCIGHLIRKFTPRELFRLQDLPDEYTTAIQAAGISKTQQHKLAGNSIPVKLLYLIFRNLFINEERQ